MLAPSHSKFRIFASNTYARLRRSLPIYAEGRRERWIRDHYNTHNAANRRRLFMDLAHFCHVNRPYEGYYFEFGSHSGRTMRLAWDSFRYLFDLDYVAFDSFEGLPAIEDIDTQAIWEKGKLKTAESEFRAICEKHGIPRERLTTVPGFYETSLTPSLRDRLAPKKAAIIYIDCDLYSSTVPVLDFILHFLQPGTLIVFDDWNCFYGDPERGERRAWREFRERYPELRFEEIMTTPMQKIFAHLGPVKAER